MTRRFALVAGILLLAPSVFAGCNLWVSLDGYGRGRTDDLEDAASSFDASDSEGPREDADKPDQLEAPDRADAQDLPESSLCSEDDEQPCYEGPPGTLNKGVCRTGMSRCTLGAWQPCVGDVRPLPESCNDQDDDCDGFVDEELVIPCYTGTSGTAGVGVCQAGNQVCAQGSWGACEGQIVPKAEDCNHDDDDCDGLTDEFSGPQGCYEGPAGTSGVGLCHGGTRACEQGSWAACEGQVLPAAEVCDGEDNDCNGVDDDEPPDIHAGVACGDQCLTTVNDSDCDGLVGNGSQDLWPSDCNPLLFGDRFAVSPVPPQWLSTGNVVQSCGKVTLAAGARLSLAALPPAIILPTYLAETRVSVGAAMPAGSTWSVGIASALQGTSQYRNCEIFADATTGPFAFLRVVVFDGTSTGTHKDLVYQINHLPGSTYLLQTYGTATMHHCRLLSSSGMSFLVGADQVTGTVALQGPGTVSVFASGRDATFDYLRVFDVP